MKVEKKKSKYILCYLLVYLISLLIFNNNYAVHHHKRLSLNLTQGTDYFWKKRLLIVDSSFRNKLEIESNKVICKIKNRNLIILYKKSGNYFHILNNKQDLSLKFVLPDNLILIGYDGEIKYKSDAFVSLKKIIYIIDNMPVRIDESQNDNDCEE